MLYFNQFLLPILSWAFCVFYTLLLILMFPKFLQNKLMKQPQFLHADTNSQKFKVD